LNSEEYEKLVKEIFNKIYINARGCNPDKIKVGRTNRIIGKSGYLHQIDVSLHGANELILIECKKWKSRISVLHFLAFLGRINDIAPKIDNYNVSGMIFTTKGFQKGVIRLAEYYTNIELVIAASLDKIIFKYGENFRRVLISPPPISASVTANNPIVNISKKLDR
jgi:hypothetical protein